MNDGARVILALAAEADDEFIWNHLKVIQAEMFGAGPVSIKFAYYGAEDGRQIRPFITTQWIVDPDDMAEVMERGRAHCVCGCFIDVGDILAAALKESQEGPVQAVIIIGDHFHGDLECGDCPRQTIARCRNPAVPVSTGTFERDRGGFSDFGRAHERRVFQISADDRTHSGNTAAAT